MSLYMIYFKLRCHIVVDVSIVKTGKWDIAMSGTVQETGRDYNRAEEL